MSTDSVDVALVIVALSITTVRLRAAVTSVPKGCVWACRMTGPVKPPLPVTVMVEFFEVPWKMVRLAGSALMMKSGGATTTRSLA